MQSHDFSKRCKLSSFLFEFTEEQLSISAIHYRPGSGGDDGRGKLNESLS